MLGRDLIAREAAGEPAGAAVVAPGLMVLAIILFMGKVSGAHLNPAVSFAFALRGDFPWRRVPGYIVIQLVGAALAAWFLQAVVNVSASYGSNYPAASYSSWDAFLMETVLTLGLVSVILGTASGAQNLGVFGALGVGGYIALAGLRARFRHFDEPGPHLRPRSGQRRL
jgi:aquaporin Z